MTKEDLIASMVILMDTYKSKQDAAEAIFRLWAIHTELEVKGGKILYKTDGTVFK